MKTKTTKRFDRAISKLYPAFHNGTLDAMKCKMCAVGNMCDNTSHWKFNGFRSNTGYSPVQLMWIEKIFMFGRVPQSGAPKEKGAKWREHNGVRSGWTGWEVSLDKNIQFKALCAVIEYLCKLDNIPNVMDYTCLFETTEEGTPKHELCTN